MKFVLACLLFDLMKAEAQYTAGCDFFQPLQVGSRYEIFSRGYKSGNAAKRFSQGFSFRRIPTFNLSWNFSEMKRAVGQQKLRQATKSS